jgi:ABC-type branched-subunit amino acid transport system substrate-binding protein
MYADGADSATIGRLRDHIIESRPDLLIWIGRPRSLAILLPPLRDALPDVAVLCTDACDTPLVYRNADGVFTGMHFVRFTNPSDQDASLSSFQERYHARTGQRAGSEAVLTYDAVSLVRAALKDGARTREDVRRYLASLGAERPAFRGLTGLIEFDTTGAFPRRYMLAEVGADSVTSARHAPGAYPR